ncbi:MAG TPA: phenylalanine 4-monooxygenase [Alphaproteobacteria bacterium]|jgi:phenylalanine-4-hydroxylase|nr:phenylalanine 4-monooxygenase [Alphaproteobacteria bacterium]
MTDQSVETPSSDFVIDQGFDLYTPDDHAIWRTLFHRQAEILKERAAPEFLAGLAGLGIAADGIPNFERLSDVLEQATRWRIVAVPGLVPDDVFFRHLANRRFPATNFIRRWDQLDYLQEPDVFHDIYGHVPMLFNPVFADYLQAYGMGGLKALSLDSLTFLARLYWYTVEFGLIRTPEGLRIYGSGIVSSKGESIYALESNKPRRLPFDLMRIMQTDYRIDDFQDIYFVIDSYEQLFAATRPDFTPYYAALKTLPTIPPGDVLPNEREIPSLRRRA